MNISKFADSLLSLPKENPIVAGIAGLVLLYLLIRKPKLFLGLLFLTILVAATLYFITDISAVGKSGKGKMIEKGIHPGMDNLR